MDTKDKVDNNLTEVAEKDSPAKNLVTIYVNSQPVQIHRGHQSVQAIKEAGNVPLAFDLDEVVNGVLKPLPDDGSVVIKGDEQFLSHAKDGPSA